MGAQRVDGQQNIAEWECNQRTAFKLFLNGETWQIAKSIPGAGALSSTEPAGFWASLGLQFVNVKIILYGITALSTFVLPVTREPVWLISVSLLLAAIGALGNLCWALAGHLFQRLFLLYGRQLNWGMAALLFYCALRIVVE